MYDEVHEEAVPSLAHDQHVQPDEGERQSVYQKDPRVSFLPNNAVLRRERCGARALLRVSDSRPYRVAGFREMLGDMTKPRIVTRFQTTFIVRSDIGDYETDDFNRAISALAWRLVYKRYPTGTHRSAGYLARLQQRLAGWLKQKYLEEVDP